MKVNYKIDCRHCGSHTEYSVDLAMVGSVELIECAMHIDTECAIRCPSCRRRLNGSEADFRSQVSMTRIA